MNFANGQPFFVVVMFHCAFLNVEKCNMDDEQWAVHSKRSKQKESK